MVRVVRPSVTYDPPPCPHGTAVMTKGTRRQGDEGKGDERRSHEIREEEMHKREGKRETDQRIYTKDKRRGREET